MKKLPKGYSYNSEKKKYCFRFTFESKRYSVYGDTIKECENKAAEKKNDLKNHMHLENKKITFRKYYADWLLSRDGVVKQSTIYDNQKCYDRLNNDFLDLKIIDIQRADIIKLQKELSKELTTAGVKHTITFISTVLNSAINDRIINYNPCKAVKPLKRTEPKAADTIHRALTIEEQKLFFKYASESYYFNLMRFMINSGCRLGEAGALTWKDIDYSKNVIFINKTISRISDKKYIIEDTPKTDAGKREIPITDALKEILEAQKLQNQMLSIKTFDQRIFPATKGQFVNAGIISTCIRHTIERLEKNEKISFDRFSSHAFRDTFATRCIEQGMQPQTLKTILGHSSLSMTMDLYAHVLPNTKAAEMQKIQIAI